MTEEVRVDTGDLRRKSNQIEALSESALQTFDVGNEVLNAPDQLPGSQTAIDNLGASLDAVRTSHQWAATESNRIGELLKNVAKTYDDVDQRSWESIQNGTPPPSEPLRPDAPSTPPGTPPQAAGAPVEITDDEDMEPPQVQDKLDGGDGGSSLVVAVKEWRDTATRLKKAADDFHIDDVDWYGVAAEQAYGSFQNFGNYLRKVATAWTDLATQGDKLLVAHKAMKDNHRPIAEKYTTAYENWLGHVGDPGEQTAAMASARSESETMRTEYASARKIEKVHLDGPPTAVATTAGPGVTTNGDPRRPAGVPKEGEPPNINGQKGDLGAGGGGASGGGGGATGGGGGAPAPAAAPSSEPSTSPASAQQPSGSGGSSGGASGQGQGQGSSGGGSPAGGGSGSPVGTPGSGVPKISEPKPPGEASLEPASAGGGSGGGSGGGGGGGGVPAAPLGPPVGAETVTANPAGAKGGVPAAAAAAGSGGMGGGMGGMPMGHGAGGHGQGGQDKKRNPALSLDEDLYTEDRPHSEAIIGQRARRKDGTDKEPK